MLHGYIILGVITTIILICVAVYRNKRPPNPAEYAICFIFGAIWFFPVFLLVAGMFAWLVVKLFDVLDIG